MLNALSSFKSCIQSAKENGVLHAYLVSNLCVPFSFDDILRSQVVYAISAFDKLLHDLIRVGMLNQYLGTRAPTPKFSADPIQMSVHQSIVSSMIPGEAVSIYEQALFVKLGYLSFQEPKKVADGLSYIWDNKDKWGAIATEMGYTTSAEVKTLLSLYVSRRNAIVHEADMDPLQNEKNSISRVESDNCVEFIESCGNAITRLVSA